MDVHLSLRNRNHPHKPESLMAGTRGSPMGSIEMQRWPRSQPAGANGDSMGGVSSMTTGTAAGMSTSLFLSLLALVGVIFVGVAFAVTSGVMFPPILSDIDSLEGKIDNCHCTVFPTDTFGLFDPDNPETFIRFSAENITINATHNYLWPDKNGTVALTSDLHPPQTVFTDGEFAIVHEFVPSREMHFDVGGISNSTVRTFGWQDVDGIVALLADIPVLTSVFLVQSPFWDF